MHPTEALLRDHLGDALEVTRIEPITGRGVFSIVERCHLRGSAAPAATVVVKRPTDGPNHRAALDGGAYRREALAYRELGEVLDGLGPACHATVDHDDGGITFVLEDLERSGRAADQVVGLTADDAHAVLDTLARWHRRGAELDLAGLDVRRSTPSLIPLAAATAGLDRLPPGERAVFAALLERAPALIEAFDARSDITLCHGDPRGDNVVIVDDPSGAEAPARLLDFQQLAVQTRGADLAWLLATSLDPDVRRAHWSGLMGAYSEATGRPIHEAEEATRIGTLLPGLAVLLLVQREVSDGRGRAMVARSVERISAMVADLL